MHSMSDLDREKRKLSGRTLFYMRARWWRWGPDETVRVVVAGPVLRMELDLYQD